ncbi:MAG: fibronectin type III domain-containing protein [Dermatophilaceae bacterium]|nr:fibronectin type III domain-containing protein [Dermatophilaceae bacterium]
MNWRTSAGRSGSWACATGCSGGTAAGLGTSQQSMDIQACNVSGRCSPWSNNITFHPYGPTNAVPGLRETHDDNSITFTWGTAGNEGRPITGYEIDGDRNQTVDAGTHSTTFGGLGYSTSRRIRVRAIAQDSGPGPWTAYVTGTTNAAPPPPPPTVDWVRPYGATGYQPGCDSGDCQWIQYHLSNFEGGVSIYCTFDSSNGTWPYNRDDGTNGSIQPGNGTNTSGKFFGFPKGWVKVTCHGTNGSDSFMRNPWG